MRSLVEVGCGRERPRAVPGLARAACGSSVGSFGRSCAVAPVSFASAACGCAGTRAAFWRSSSLAGPLRQLCAIDADSGSGKISSSAVSTPSKMPWATDSGRTSGSRGRGSCPSLRDRGSRRAGYAPLGTEHALRLRQREQGRLRDRDAGSAGTAAQVASDATLKTVPRDSVSAGRERVRQVVRAEQIDRQAPFQRGALAEVS